MPAPGLVRQGIRALLEKASDIQVIAEAADGREAVELVGRLAPEVLVMDIAMPRLDGIQATKQIQDLGLATQVVILSMYSDEALVRRALRNGARGYLLKRSVSEELWLAVRAASRGEIYLSLPISKSVLGDFFQAEVKENSVFDRLTPRERSSAVVVVLGEGEDVLSQARDLRPHIVLIDPFMPLGNKSGLEAVSRLRSALPQVGIVVLTLVSSNGYRQAALAAGADDFVPKTEVYTDLLPVIDQLARVAPRPE